MTDFVGKIVNVDDLTGRKGACPFHGILQFADVAGPRVLQQATDALDVVDTIPSPVDSQERRTLYIRGSEGLQQELKAARRQTFEQIEYVGEWHSHPNGVECLPSGDDLNVLRWLTTHMDADGVPGVMMIACERDQLAVLLAQVARDVED